MTINYTITTLKRDLIRSFAVLDSWFDKDDDYLDFRPPDRASVREVFARALNTGEGIMAVIDAAGDATQIVSGNIARTVTIDDLTSCLDDENAASLLETLFAAVDQLHTAKSLPEIRSELRDQLDRCLCHLELLSNGEGVFLNTSFEIADSIDFYQCIQLLSIAIKVYAKQLTDLEQQFADVRS